MVSSDVISFVSVDIHAAFVRCCFTFKFSTVFFYMTDVKLGSFNAAFYPDYFSLEHGDRFSEFCNCNFCVLEFFIDFNDVTASMS